MALVLTGAVPAVATEWFICHSADAALELGLLMGGDETLGPAAATLTVASSFYTTDPAYGDGAAIAVAQSYFGPDLIQVDLRDGDVNEHVARVRLVSAASDTETVRAGTVEVFGSGVWPVICGQ